MKGKVPTKLSSLWLIPEEADYVGIERSNKVEWAGGDLEGGKS